MIVLTEMGILVKDEQQQSVIRATQAHSLVVLCKMSYHIPQDSLYICLSNHIKEVIITLIFKKLWNINHFIYFCSLDMDISLDIYFPQLKLYTVLYNIHLKKSMSQIVY